MTKLQNHSDTANLCMSISSALLQLCKRKVQLTVHSLERALPAIGREKRELQYALGRKAAAEVLAAFGYSPEQQIGRGEGGEPLWPSGLVGSIAHSGPVALAAASQEVRALGVDIESVQRGRSRARAIQSVLHPQEEIEARTSEDGIALSYFCAKEAAYKAGYTLGLRGVYLRDYVFAALAQKDSENLRDILLLQGQCSADPTLTFPCLSARAVLAEEEYCIAVVCVP